MEFSFTPEIIELIKRLALAGVLGGLIGLERDIHGRAAGLRTHLLVGLGSALFMILSKIIASHGGTDVVTDPGRIAAQIVTGIGFLGAGAIMKEGFTVRGLTTASCFWVVAAIGMATGIGEFTLAVTTTLLALLALSILHHLDKLYKRDSYRSLLIKMPLDEEVESVLSIIKEKNVKIIFVDFTKDYTADCCTVKLSLRLFHRGSTDKISQNIVRTLEESGISLKQISWHHGKMY